MVKRIRIHKKHTIPVIPPTFKEETQISEGQFPLNINDSDRIQWTVQLNREGKIVEISNISYEIKYDEQWIWIVRYDDHGGQGEFHKHERITFNNNNNVLRLVNFENALTKEQEKQAAINDLRENYLLYREGFLTNLGLAIY